MLRDLLNVFRQNFAMTQWTIDVLDAFNVVERIMNEFYFKKSAVEGDANLTSSGKDAARKRAAEHSAKLLSDWFGSQAAGLDAQIAHLGAGLLPTEEKADQDKVDRLLNRLLECTPEEITTLYAAAEEEDRALMEAASQRAGRVPMKVNGRVCWGKLLDDDLVSRRVLDRASLTNPDGVAKYRELGQLRDMHEIVFNHAINELNAVLAGAALTMA